MPRPKPGVPSLLRELNDSTAFNHIMEVGGVTRADLASHSGLSRVTSSQALQRLEARGLITVQGQRAGAKGPAADFYTLAPGLGVALGLAIHTSTVRGEALSLTGEVLGTAETPLSGDVVAACARARDLVLAEVGADHGPVLAAAVATPGVVDPATGDLSFSYDMPDSADLRQRLEGALALPVALGNNVHLAAMAERLVGAARGLQDFVLLWFDTGLGMAGVIDGRVRTGSSGASGEIGYLPVPGVDLPRAVDTFDQGAFQRLVGAAAIEALALEHGVDLTDPAAIAAAPSFVAELGHRISLGVAAIGTILDPELFVLSGASALLVGHPLAQAVASATVRIAPIHPRVEISVLGFEGPVRGAGLRALEDARRLIRERITAE